MLALVKGDKVVKPRKKTYDFVLLSFVGIADCYFLYVRIMDMDNRFSLSFSCKFLLWLPV